jgi:hypothetical protein
MVEFKKLCYSEIKKWSPPFGATTVHIQNEKARLISDLRIHLTNIRKAFYVNAKNEIVKIIF